MPSDKEIDDMIEKLKSMKKGKKKAKTLDDKMREEHRSRTEDRNRRRGFSDEEAKKWRNMGKALTDKDLDRIFKKDKDK